MFVPVYIDGQEAGRLTLAREGLYTRLRAECRMREGLTRLWLHGGGESRYLGLLAPEGGRLTLEKRLSRAALPKTIDYASDSPEGNSECGMRNSELAGDMPVGAGLAPPDDQGLEPSTAGRASPSPTAADVQPVGRDDPSAPEDGDRDGDGGRPGAAAPTTADVLLSVGAGLAPPDDQGPEPSTAGRASPSPTAADVQPAGRDDPGGPEGDPSSAPVCALGHLLPSRGEGKSNFVLLPCAPSVPGAAQIGGRWVLVISPPGRYNNDIG